MNIEIIILICSWVLTISMLLIFVPKNKFREAQVIFFLKQIMTWFFGLTVAEFKLIEYPVRLFSYATKTSFTFEFFVYPSICIVFVLYYPKGKSYIRKFLYYFYFSTVITIIEVILEKYTNLITYIHWSWYMTWITLFITFYISRKYYEWFFRINAKK